MEELEFKGWYTIEFTSGRTALVNLSHAIRDTRGYVMYMVDHDRRYYNFHNVVSFKKEDRSG